MAWNQSARRSLAAVPAVLVTTVVLVGMHEPSDESAPRSERSSVESVPQSSEPTVTSTVRSSEPVEESTTR